MTTTLSVSGIRAAIQAHGTPGALTESGKFRTVANGFGGTTVREPGTRQVSTRRFSNHTVSAPLAPKLATEPQKGFIRKLLVERQGNEAAEIIRTTLNSLLGTPEFTTKVASATIESLLAIPVSEAPVVTHEPSEVPSDRQVELPVWPGRYTVETAQGHRTFRVSVQDSKADFAPGELIISFLSGQDNSSDYTSFGFVKAGRKLFTWKRFRDNAQLVADAQQFLADPDAALECVQCARCGEDLTVPESIAAGFGPVCIKKGLR